MGDLHLKPGPTFGANRCSGSEGWIYFGKSYRICTVEGINAPREQLRELIAYDLGASKYNDGVKRFVLFFLHFLRRIFL